jgi:catechol 2,3-dioxygenase-like lactoylglutathione lyase family enzyme
MQLGNFSVSLNVKDLQASKAFYAALGFEPIGGDDEQGWSIIRNGGCILGLFQGMLEKNTLTFNPGWNANGETLDDFTDIRDLQRKLKSQGMALASEADEDSTGPASFMIVDPDGNPILVDQHV